MRHFQWWWKCRNKNSGEIQTIATRQSNFLAKLSTGTVKVWSSQSILGNDDFLGKLSSPDCTYQCYINCTISIHCRWQFDCIQICNITVSVPISQPLSYKLLTINTQIYKLGQPASHRFVPVKTCFHKKHNCIVFLFFIHLYMFSPMTCVSYVCG